MTIHLSIRVILLLIFIIGPTLVNAADKVGYIDYVRGVVSAQHHEMGSRILSKSAEVYEEDTIKTGNRSFAIVKMKDGTRITIRPNSSLGIEKYIARKGQTDSAILNLFKGGIRAITGFISKNRENAYKIKTSVATIGIRGTEFDARLCSSDCGDEANRYRKNKNVETTYVVGRVAFLRGQLSATDRQKKTRQVYTGGPIYEGDTLKTGYSSFSVLAFKDESRVTLKPSTIFEIKKHHYDEKEPSISSAFMVLLRGGLRALSGFIGKNRRNAYKMKTPVATIGIRGTGYDIQCEGDCLDASPQSLLTPLERMLDAIIKPAVAALDGSGLYAHVWSGAIELNNNAGSQLLNTNQTAFLKNSNSVPVLLPNVPIFIRATPAPRPDKIKIESNLFKQGTQKNIDPGLYVSVYDGHVSVDNQQGGRVDLGKGEAAFAGNVTQKPIAPVRLKVIPEFQSNDAYPRPESYSESWENLFNDVTNTDENQDLECTPQ